MVLYGFSARGLPRGLHKISLCSGRWWSSDLWNCGRDHAYSKLFKYHVAAVAEGHPDHYLGNHTHCVATFRPSQRLQVFLQASLGLYVSWL